MQESELRKYVARSIDQTWGYPLGRQVFSQFVNGEYICMTDKGINFWEAGKLTLICRHDAETQARYAQLMQRRP